MVAVLRESKHPVEVYLDVVGNSAGYYGINMGMAGNLKQEQNSLNGIGNGALVRSWAGTEIFSINGVYRNDLIVLAHELQHAYDHVTGSFANKGFEVKNGVKYLIKDELEHEYRAVRTGNIVRSSLGVPLRTSYGGVPVPNFEPRFSPIN